MKSYGEKLEIIKPEWQKSLNEVRAFFTCKNINYSESNQNIQGLNLGFNTADKKEVVEKNRRDLLDYLSIPQDVVAYADQVHGNRVQVVEEGGTYTDTDALITQVPGLALAIQVADCAAVLLYDEMNRITGAVHAGWRGAASDIIPKTINQMEQLGAETAHMYAFVSPCISQRHFEVGEEVANKFPEPFVDYQTYEKPHIDLKTFISHQLNEYGVAPERTDIHRGCTVSEAGRYYSYRREQKQSGRMFGLIQLHSL